MVKLKTTRKAILNSGADVYRVGYCGLQYLLSWCGPFAYSTRVEGWACDYYDIDGVIISTGYAPIGKKTSYATISKFEKLAKEITRGASFKDYENTKKQLQGLASELVRELAKND